VFIRRIVLEIPTSNKFIYGKKILCYFKEYRPIIFFLLFLSIAALIQGNIFEDSLSDSVVSNNSFQFELDTFFLLPECGGCAVNVDETILNQETCSDIELREKILSGVVPTIDTIYRFISY
jgi:hypothetical protein